MAPGRLQATGSLGLWLNILIAVPFFQRFRVSVKDHDRRLFVMPIFVRKGHACWQQPKVGP